MKLERPGRHLTDPHSHRSPDHDACTVQTGLHGFVAEAQTPSRFAGTQSFNIPQNEHGAIGFRERIDRCLQHAVQFLCIGLTLGVRFR